MSPEAALAAYATETCAGARVEVVASGLAPGVVPEGAVVAWSGDPCRPRPVLSLTVGQGAEVRTLTVRPRLAGWSPGPVAAADVPFGAPVDVLPGLVPWSACPGAALSGRPLATRALRAGEPVCALDVRPAPDAVAGAAVTVSVRVGALEVTADGHLLDDAIVGGPARVRRGGSGVVLHGTLVAPDRVELGRAS